MPRKLSINAVLNAAELEARYRKARDPVERSHLQIIWLLAQGKTAKEVAGVTGYSTKWIGKIAHRYTEFGSQGLGDRRHQNPGASPFLSPDQLAELRQALQGPAADGGIWNCRKVAEWIQARTGRPVSVQRGWDYLQRLSASDPLGASRRTQTKRRSRWLPREAGR